MGTIIWTDAEIDQLIWLWNYTILSASEIAAKIGKTKNAVIGKADRLNLPPRRGSSRRPYRQQSRA